jgi:Mg2+ and Co2+ transporter CorA
MGNMKSCKSHRRAEAEVEAYQELMVSNQELLTAEIDGIEQITAEMLQNMEVNEEHLEKKIDEATDALEERINASSKRFVSKIDRAVKERVQQQLQQQPERGVS